MTKEDVLSEVEATRPNIIASESKKRWLNTLENEILAHMTRYGEVTLEAEGDLLLLGEDYKDMYVYYVVSMIDLANQDVAMYNNSASFFNEKFLAWQKKWRREHLPRTGSEVM